MTAPQSTIEPAAAARPCPHCPGVLDDQADNWLACRSCGHRVSLGWLAEYDAATFGLSQAAARQDLAVRAIRAGVPLDQQPLLSGEEFLPTGWRASEPQPAGISTQAFLLGGGGLLLSLAGVTFAALAWSTLGAEARLGLLFLGSLVALVVGVAIRERVPDAADAVTAVGAVLITVTGYASQQLGVLGADWNATRMYFWFSAVHIAVGAGAFFGFRRLGIRAWKPMSAASVGAGLVAGGLGATNAFGNPLGFTLVAMAAAALGVGLLRLSDLAGPAQAVPTPWQSLVAVLLCVGAAPVFLHSYEFSTTGLFMLAGVAVALLVGVLSWVDPDTVPVGFAGYLASATAAWSIGTAFAFHRGAAGPNLICAVLAGLILVVGSRLSVSGAEQIAITGAVVVGLAGLVCPMLAHGVSSKETSARFFIVLACSCGVVTYASRDPRAASGGWVAAALGIIGWLSLTADAHLPAEGVSLPAASIAAVGTALWAGRTWIDTRLLPGSLPLLLPAGVIAVVPSGLSDLHAAAERGDIVTRTVVLICAGAILVALGARFRLAGAIAVGAIALGFGMLTQLDVTARTLPAWVTLAVAGLALLALGARWEWLRAQPERARNWTGMLR